MIFNIIEISLVDWFSLTAELSFCCLCLHLLSLTEELIFLAVTYFPEYEPKNQTSSEKERNDLKSDSEAKLIVKHASNERRDYFCNANEYVENSDCFREQNSLVFLVVHLW